MTDPADLAAALRQELAAEAFRAAAHRADDARVQGVAWAGLEPEPLRPLTAGALQAQAVGRAAARDAWRRSPAGRALAALVEVERMAGTIRAALARDPGQDLSRSAAALAAAADRVLGALRT